MKSLYQYESSRFCFLVDFIPNKSANSYLSPTTGFSQNLASVAMDLDFDVLFCPIHTGEFDLVFPPPFQFPDCFLQKNQVCYREMCFDLSAFLLCLGRFTLFTSPDFFSTKFLNPGICSKSPGLGLSALAFPLHFPHKKLPHRNSPV